MRVYGTVLVLALAFAMAPALAAAESADGVQWERDYKKALETAKKENKRVFIEFTAEW